MFQSNVVLGVLYEDAANRRSREEENCSQDHGPGNGRKKMCKWREREREREGERGREREREKADKWGKKCVRKKRNEVGTGRMIGFSIFTTSF